MSKKLVIGVPITLKIFYNPNNDVLVESRDAPAGFVRW
jgi:hypothetical protein